MLLLSSISMPHCTPLFFFFFFNDTATTEIYTLSLHDALPIYRSFDQFAGAFAEASKDAERLLFDAHAAEWASPYGLVGLLAAGQATRRGGSAGGADRPLLTAPTNPDVLSYWTRAGFFREAAQLFAVHGQGPRAKAAEQ